MGLCLLRPGNRHPHLRDGFDLHDQLLTSTPFASTVHQDPKLLAGVLTKTEAGFVVAVPGSDTLQSSCFLGLAT